jgi:Flp pilus assembly pilin Flp
MLLSYFVKDEEGQDITEYGLMIAFIALLVVIAVLVFTGALQGFFSSLGAEIDTWVN